MKKVILHTAIYFITFFIALLMFNSVDSNKTNISKMIEEFKKHEKLLSSSDNYYNPKDNKIINENVSLLLDVAYYDFNNDDEKELIASRVKDNSIILTMYKVDGDAFKEIDSITLFEDVLNFFDEINLDCFVKIISNKIYILSESTSYSNLVADGVDWKFVMIGFDNNKFVEVSRNQFAGSYFDEETLDEKKSSLKTNNIVINSFGFEENGKSLFDQNNSNASMLFNITRKHLDSFNASDYYDSKETNVKYGITSYKSYNSDLDFINKNLKDK